MKSVPLTVTPGQIDAIVKSLSQRLTAHRLHHTLGVLQTALVLTETHGGDRGRIVLAALLHDCAKSLEPGPMAEAAARDNRIDPADFGFPQLLHAAASTVIAREELGVTDEEVLDAIRNHPTGRGNPSHTLMILMAADFTEPTRAFPGVQEARYAVRADLRTGLLQILRNKAQHVLSRGRKLNNRVFDAIKSLEERES